MLTELKGKNCLSLGIWYVKKKHAFEPTLHTINQINTFVSYTFIEELMVLGRNVVINNLSPNNIRLRTRI